MRPKKSNSIIGIKITRSRGSMTDQRQNCLWICLLICCSCHIFGLLRLAEALSFEYLDEHDDLNYDLDTAQSQAKYDARLLSQQMLSDAELQQKADSDRPMAPGADSNEDDLEPHSRAAACITNARKYTHGQKVPRLDPCEVCLCMDGEIFCWWEKCDKANAHTATTDYSDPYRYETTTKKSTKLHKAARKLAKRHKHHKNQKNFNDYEVYHSHKQSDYIKGNLKQQKQTSGSANKPSNNNSNTNKPKQQRQKLKMTAPSLLQGQEQDEAALVNQAAKEIHYQQQQQPEQPQPQRQQQHQEQEQQQEEHTQQRPPHSHPHPSHSSSKILSFPENLPALLYYDYKTEEHEHHQHQHHQQHLLHQKQRLQQQQQHQLEARRLSQTMAPKAVAVAAAPQRVDVELSTAVGGADKNFDEAETDSDILPEPPTKRPKATWTSKATSTTVPQSTAKALMTMATTTTRRTATTEQTAVDKKNEMPQEHVAKANQQYPEHNVEVEDLDDAFHRWLTSTELNVDSTNTFEDNLPAAAEQETSASTIIDDVGAKSNNNSNSKNNTEAVSAKVDVLATDRRGVQHKDSNGNPGNGNSNSMADNADAVFFRSSYNDYSSEFNGSVVNIDITLTAVDVHPHPHSHSQHPRQPEITHMLSDGAEADLIANDNTTAAASTATTTTSATTTATATLKATTATTTAVLANNQHTVRPPYTLESILATTTTATLLSTTTTAPPTGRMCNVLGKLYKIGDILPQDTGNCLQCICTDAITPQELPSVTCSPHNCPPLVLPDLFDATGY